MVIKVTRWTPDTCDCTVEYSWDSESPAETRVHEFFNTVKTCPEHVTLPGPQLMATMGDECKRKNLTLKELLDSNAAGEDGMDDDGEPIRVLKKGLKFEFSYTGVGDQRVLHVTIKNKKSGAKTMTIPQKNALQAVADSKFGAGKVVVE